MIRKMITRCALVGALALAASSCFEDYNGTSQYEGYARVSFEPEYLAEWETFINTYFKGGKDSVYVDDYFTVSPLTILATKADDGSLVGGFALCMGTDTLATPDHTPSRFAVFDEGGNDETIVYAVFHDTTATLMPEHSAIVAIPNEESSCPILALYVQNVQAVVQAALCGTGLQGGPFGESDYLTLTIKATRNGVSVGEKSVKLVDGTKVLDGWTQVELTDFKSAECLDFSLTSSRSDMPLYCCMDDLLFHYMYVY